MRRFDRFAEACSRFAASGPFFLLSVVVVLLWLPTIALFASVDTWQLVINTATSVLAFLLVALLQNSERRKDEAAHEKLDALVEAIAELLEDQTAGDPDSHERLRRELLSVVGSERRA